MSIPALINCAQELRRLSIGGSGLARDDFRLKRLRQALQASAENAPVFARVADQIEALVNADPDQSAEALLDLGTLTHAILHTQGQTGRSGELEPLKPVNTGLKTTPISVKVLRPLIEALTTTGSGRQRVIEEAHERGVFKDLRLIGPSISALEDPYGEIASFVAEKVLPSFGAFVAPMLQADLDLKGNAAHGRRLRVLGKLLDRSGWDLYVRALDEGSKPVQLAAIECLAPYDDALPLIEEQVNAKSGDLRAAALRAIGTRDTDAAVDILIDAVRGPDLERAMEPIMANTHPRLREAVLAETSDALNELLATPKVTEKMHRRVCILLQCVGERMDKPAEKFLRQCLKRSDELAGIKISSRTMYDRLGVSETIAWAIERFGSKAARKDLIAAGTTPDGDAFYSYALRSAQRDLSAKAFFDQFSGSLKDKSASGKARARILHDHIQAEAGFDWYRTVSMKRLDGWDRRWLDLVVGIGNATLASALAQPGHRKCIDLLTKAAEKTKNHDGAQAIMGLIRAEDPKVAETFCGLLRRSTKSTRTWSWWLLSLVALLPKDADDKLKALASDLPDKVAMELLDRLAERQATRAASSSN